MRVVRPGANLPVFFEEMELDTTLSESQPSRILILAGDSDGNLGDRAIVFATCCELRRLRPEIQISVLSGNPDRDRDYFGVDAIPRGPRGFLRLLRTTMQSDAVLCGGGGLFQDDTSLIKMPYWAARLLLLRCFGGKIFGYSLGVGPLNRLSSRLAARLAFFCMRMISVRDKKAQDLSKQLTKTSVRLVPDPALLLEPRSALEARGVLSSAGVPVDGTTLIGVAARRWFHHYSTLIPHKLAVQYGLRPIPGGEANHKMISLLAQVLDGFVEKHNAHVVFLPSYNVGHEADDATCQEIADTMNEHRKTVLVIDGPRLYKAITGQLDLMLGSRMHPLIFAAAMGISSVGLSYNPKFDGFFDLLGGPQRLIKIEDFVANDATPQLASLLDRALAVPRPDTERLTQLSEMTQQFTADVLNGPNDH